MVAKLRRKKPLDNQDVNAHSSRRRMHQKHNSLLLSLNKENISAEGDPIDKSSDSGGSGLTGLINRHLEEKTPLLSRVTQQTSSKAIIPLTADALRSLQDNLHDLEIRLAVKQSLPFLKEVNYSELDYTQRRNNFLFELDCFPDVSWLEKGNLRTGGYIPNVYQMLDPDWYFNQGISQEDFSYMTPTLKLFNVLTPLIEVSTNSNCANPGNAKVQVEDILSKPNFLGSRLSFRASSKVFDENVDPDWLLRHDTSDDEISLADSLDHCNSVQRKAIKKKLNRKSILFFKHREKS